jgi:hypothetical protein
LADPLQDSLIREIDEDLRKERYAKLWKSYGNYVIAGAVALVVGVAGFQGWYSYDLDRRKAQGEQLARAMNRSADDPSVALGEMQSLAENAGDGYALLARFQEAALLAKGGDQQAAIAIYRELATEADIPMYRDLAVVLGAQNQLASAGSSVDRVELERTLQPITVDDNPWRYSAREIMGILAMQAGENAKAVEIFSALATDLRAPQGMRSRAAVLQAVAEGG